jgi:hypothetical protein
MTIARIASNLLGLASHPALASVTFVLLGAAASGVLVALLHREHRSAMLVTSAGALLGWAFMVTIFFKQGALRHSFQQIVAVTILYYLVALTGFVIGGFLLTSAAKPITPPSDHRSPAC